MNNRISKTVLFLLLVLVFSACNSNPSVTVQATRTIPQTVTATATPSQATATWYLKTATTNLSTPPPDDTGYFEGVIIITRYYTFLGHGLYEEAYQLLSPSAQQNAVSLEDYIKNGKRWYKKVEIISIVPQYLRTDTMDKRRFIVTFISWGEGRLSGAGISGKEQTVYLTLVGENGQWRIDASATA